MKPPVLVYRLISIELDGIALGGDDDVGLGVGVCGATRSRCPLLNAVGIPNTKFLSIVTEGVRVSRLRGASPSMGPRWASWMSGETLGKISKRCAGVMGAEDAGGAIDALSAPATGSGTSGSDPNKAARRSQS